MVVPKKPEVKKPEVKKPQPDISFLIRVEGLVPTIIEYEIRAKDKEEALAKYNQNPSLYKVVRSIYQVDKIRKVFLSIKNITNGVVELIKRY